MVRVAFRNLARQVRRTLLVGFLFAFAAASLVVNISASNGIGRMIDESVQRYLTGNVLIQSEANKAELGKLQMGKIAAIKGWRAVDGALRDNPGVKGVLKRVTYTAMLTRDGKQAFATVQGAETTGDPVIPLAVKEGEGLGTGRGGILITAKHAEKLGAKVGDEVTLLASDPTGRPSLLKVKVRGIVGTVNFDMFRQTEAHVAYAEAQELFGLEGAPTEYVLSTTDSEGVARKLRDALFNVPVVVQPWTVAGQEFLKSKDQLKVSVLGMFVLFGVVIAAILFNMVQMQVHERIREIGTMSSLGMTWQQILLVLLVETFALGAVASTLGAGVTYGAIRLVGARGINWGDAPAAIFGGTVLTPYIPLGTVALFIGSLTLLGLLGAFVPAFRAARILPADSLRQL